MFFLVNQRSQLVRPLRTFFERRLGRGVIGDALSKQELYCDVALCRGFLRSEVGDGSEWVNLTDRRLGVMYVKVCER